MAGGPPPGGERGGGGSGARGPRGGAFPPGGGGRGFGGGVGGAPGGGLRGVEGRVRRDGLSGRYADVVVVRSDPLSGGPPIPWPLLDAPRVSIWDPTPVGVGEDGQVVSMNLVYRNLLLG